MKRLILILILSLYISAANAQNCYTTTITMGLGQGMYSNTMKNEDLRGTYMGKLALSQVIYCVQPDIQIQAEVEHISFTDSSQDRGINAVFIEFTKTF